jgi:hypothetical protein
MSASLLFTFIPLAKSAFLPRGISYGGDKITGELKLGSCMVGTTIVCIPRSTVADISGVINDVGMLVRTKLNGPSPKADTA